MALSSLATLNNKKDEILSSNFQGIIGVSKKMREIFSTIEKIAFLNVPVVIIGETGTGKELVARALHNLSPRSCGPFIAINCASIPRELFESELFGHLRGAFTNAYNNRKGVLEMASGGTIFLDEIGEMPIETQSKILRAIEYKEVKKVGSNSYHNIDIRIVAATNRDLPNEVINNKFRADLFYRLYVIPIFLPPLRERKEDIPYLVHFFIREVSKMHKIGRLLNISEEAMKFLMEQKWRGNVRELKNVIEQLVILCSDKSTIEIEDIKGSLLTYRTLVENESSNYFTLLQEIERNTIYTELEKHRWNKQATAHALGIAKSTLFEKIKKYRIGRDTY